MLAGAGVLGLLAGGGGLLALAGEGEDAGGGRCFLLEQEGDCWPLLEDGREGEGEGGGDG